MDHAFAPAWTLHGDDAPALRPETGGGHHHQVPLGLSVGPGMGAPLHHGGLDALIRLGGTDVPARHRGINAHIFLLPGPGAMSAGESTVGRTAHLPSLTGEATPLT